MHEGSNIHYSSDNKLLCSHSAKVCRQRRLNGYGFCVRHILEDPAAPFKQCGHVNKNNKQQCTNAIPHNEQREYCNNHLIMLGLIQKKEKKVKQTPTPTASYPSVPNAHSAPIARTDVGATNARTAPNSLPNSVPSTPGTPGTPDSYRPLFRPSLPQPQPPHDDVTQRLVASLDRSKTFVHSNGIRLQQNSAVSKLVCKLPMNNVVKKVTTNNHHDMEKNLNNAKPRLKLELAKSRGDSADDPYAFPDEPNSPTVKVACTPPQGNVSPFMSPSPAPSPVRPSWSPSTQRTPNDRSSWSPGARTPLPSPGRPTPLPSPGRPAWSPSTPRAPPRSPLPVTPERTICAARLYPELAEKLYSKPGKPQDPSKVTVKTALKSSRTMNALETKIAQNKIKDKIKRQESSLSGSDLQSPLSECSPTNSSPKTIPAFSPQSRNGLYSLDTQYLGNGPLHVGLSAHTLMSAGRSPPLPSPPQQPMTPRLPPPYFRQELPKPSTSKPLHGALYKDVSDRIKRLLKPKEVLTERQSRHKFKDKTAMDMYAHYSRRKMYTRNLGKLGIDSSESSDEGDLDMLPWQRTWFSPSSEDEEQESDESDDGLAIQRTTRQALMKTRLRRQFLQMHRNHVANKACDEYHLKTSDKLVETAKKGPDLALRVLSVMKAETEPEPPKPRSRLKTPDTRPCLANKGGPCDRPALPFTNHCRKHIMYNVDQQLFDYCTGKNDDNTQCCDPVFNVKYDFPLCAKHALVALRQAAEVTQTKKRKKTKPSALTRPPKRGRKKRALQKNKALRPSSPEDSQDDNDTITDTGAEPMETHDAEPSLSNDLITASTSADLPPSAPAPAPEPGSPAPEPGSPVPLNPVEKIAKDLAKIDRQLSTGARPFGHEPLPYNEPDLTASFPTDTSVNLEQAARLLEEHDINEVLNKLPDEAFDIFSGKNGDYIPTHEETEELERALAAVSETVNRTKHTLDQMGFMDDPGEDDDDMITKQIADQILQQNLGPDHMNNGTVSSDDHLQDLANSISDHDLKTMSQAFSAYDLESRLDPRSHHDLFGLTNGGPSRTTEQHQHAGTSSQPIEWTSAVGIPNLVPYQNGYQNGTGTNHVPQKLTQDLVALLANQLMPARGQAQTGAPNGEQPPNSLIYQFAVSLPMSQTQQNKQGT